MSMCMCNRHIISVTTHDHHVQHIHCGLQTDRQTDRQTDKDRRTDGLADLDMDE